MSPARALSCVPWTWIAQVPGGGRNSLPATTQARHVSGQRSGWLWHGTPAGPLPAMENSHEFDVIVALRNSGTRSDTILDPACNCPPTNAS